MGLVLAFFFLQRDLGPALVVSLAFLALYGVARGGIGLASLGLAIVGTGFFVGYRYGIPHTVAGRVSMWLSPWENDFAGGDHLAKTVWSLAAGGVSGAGLGRGDSALVPAIHTDMVLASVGEDLGFVGVAIVLALFALLIFRCLRISLRTGAHFCFFLALGLTLVLALQALLIAGGVLGLVPLSGIATPFLSYGRSSMLANLSIIGVLIAISHHARGAGGSLRPLHRSVRWLGLLLAAALTVVTVAAAKIQIFDADRLLIHGSLARQADGVRRYQYNPRLTRIARWIPRGSIVDRRGLPLATSDWSELERHRQEYEELGIEIGSEPTGGGGRRYPFAGLTFHLLGDLPSRLNWAASNTSFAERDSRVRLRGFDDYAQVVSVEQADGRTTPLVVRDYSELVPLLRHHQDPDHPVVRRFLDRDRTLRMTIDVRLQKRVADILERYIRLAGAERGAAVLLDAGNGDLLASVGYPWPQRSPPAAGNGDREALIDRVRYGIYAPGSAFKLVSAMAALRRDPDLRETTFRCVAVGGGRAGHRVRGWGKPIRDDPGVRTPHGTVNLRLGIRHSCNAYFAQLVTYEVGGRALLETAALFDIAVARPNTPETLQDALPQAAFGQGQVTATPFAMARVAATLANGGEMPQGRWVLDDSSPRTREPRRVLPVGDAWRIAEAMREVVTGGSGKILRSIEPPIAGKTGTAEVAGERSHGWFVGFSPYDEEEGRVVALAVLIENGGYGGRYPARAAGEMVQQAAFLGLLGDTER